MLRREREFQIGIIGESRDRLPEHLVAEVIGPETGRTD
jgi:hypothetical protein